MVYRIIIEKGKNDIRTAEIVIKDGQPPTDTICFHKRSKAGD